MSDMPFGVWIEPGIGLREDDFNITVEGTPTESLLKVTIHVVKAGYLGRDDDPKLGTLQSDGTITVTGAEIVNGLNLHKYLDNQVWIYARARLHLYGIDKLKKDEYTASTPLMIAADPIVVNGNGGNGSNGGCIEGTISADGLAICEGGHWKPYTGGNGNGGCIEGTISADGLAICEGGHWKPYTGGNGNGGTSEYLTPDQALARLNQGLPCYIKCILPILDMLPGIPYIQGIPMLPGFVITERP